MKYTRRLLAALLAAALFAVNARAGAENTLALPGAMRIIDEEAFLGSGGFDRVVLPDTTEQILAKAFAGSSLTAINLPGTVTFIAEDAFDGSKLSLVAAAKGTYGHDWALDHGYLKPLSMSVFASAADAKVNDSVTWTPEAQGGLPPYRYTFSLYKGTQLVEATELGAIDVYSRQLLEAGDYCLLAAAYDENGDRVAASGEKLTVTLNLPAVIDLSSADSAFQTIKAHIWTARAEGGSGGPYQYKFVLKQGKTTLYTRGYSAKPTLYYTFFEAGAFTLIAQVKDGSGKESEAVTQSFKVTASDAAVSGVVRVYVDIDSKGNILRTNSSKGHYELQINNSANNQLAFDDRLYTNPAFSFDGDDFGNSRVSVSNGDQILRPKSKLYTFSFSTTAAKLKDFLIDKMAALYMDTENEVEEKPWTRYEVVKGPFATYNVSKANCFTAVAAWANWLGYDTLSKIAGSASGYSDYIAWRMLDRYGSYWTYVGQKK